jgi:hypothetical protein
MLKSKADQSEVALTGDYPIKIQNLVNLKEYA